MAGAWVDTGREAARGRLADYDSNEDGPLFAVSDEGSAAASVLEAAYSSAKASARADFAADPLRLGVILDGERMTSAGETPIGPPEYRTLSSATAGNLLLTTNVGTRVNVRMAGHLPEYEAAPASVEQVIAAFQPFLNTPGGRPRPLTVRLRAAPGSSMADVAELVRQVEQGRKEGRIGAAPLHRLSLLVDLDERIATEEQLLQIEGFIRTAAELKVPEVAIDAVPLPYARKRLSAAGLLEVLRVEDLNRLLAVAVPLSVVLTTRFAVDVEASARTIWTGLEAARGQGLDGGKYGLFPLTLEEQEQAIEMITRWTAGWTAIPAFYVDTPLVTATQVFDVDRCEEAARRWLKMARGAGATVALFDAPDRVTPRRLVKSERSPEGVLNLDQIESLTRFGELLGIKIMWSGGVTAPQALDLARRQVFAIFSTSSASSKIAVTAPFSRDHRLASENEPQEVGVRRMHAAIQAGFLTTRLREAVPDLAQRLDSAAEQLVQAPADGPAAASSLATLDELLVDAWRRIEPSSSTAPARASGGNKHLPVPAAAVRVFRGRKHAGASHDDFRQRLATVFMPMTVQMQRLYGLTAYLPAVLPNADDGVLPDEVALVFYRTQESYNEAKRCIGGRAYSELHELAFDMPASRSGFPVLLADGEVGAERPYHLFDRSVDWQQGSTRLFIGRRKNDVAPSDFLQRIAAAARRVQQTPDGIDAAIFVANGESILWWDHSAEPIGEPLSHFSDLAEPAYAAAPRRLRIPVDLTEPFVGLSLESAGDFLNFQFSRI
jgi:hypothetical protein